jgi:ATP-dependent helicase HrpA
LQAALRRVHQGQDVGGELRAITQAIVQSKEQRNQRAARLPRPEVAAELPIAAYAEAISAAIARAPVVIVVGETGSGKTTQLPKCALAAGRGAAGLIGCTQPRRIAARSVAKKLSVDLGVSFGKEVGCKVRFSDASGPETLLKVMTDGILLTEITADPDLSVYDTLIFDEVHERSVNIDFLLGYAKLLIARRPDLKLIVTSATMEAERLASYFGDAPVITIPGRSFPIEVRYRPLLEADDVGDAATLGAGLLAALRELFLLGPRGDVLVFLASEREIHDVTSFLRKQAWPDVEILPLYARLSRFLQERIFQPGLLRRVILSTNVAETSLTIPRIAYVIDSGTARISRYAPGRRMQRLPIEKIAQSSAAQRKGRCGRLEPGVCIRLYAEDDLLARPLYTEPEILRGNLAAVVLRLKALRIADVEMFPFLDVPDQRALRDAHRTLSELGALDSEQRLTALGRRMAHLPVDPRIARILLAAEKEGCVAEILVIAAALSAQDPRERPVERVAAADAAHRVFIDGKSDFAGLLKLWDAYHQRRAETSSRETDRWCRENYLSPSRFQEWREVFRQLQGLVQQLGLPLSTARDNYAAIHRALLSGFLANVACRGEQQNYEGAFHKRLTIFPGSGLASKGPKWIVAAEQVQTHRLFARYVAAIDPSWLVSVAGSLCQRKYSQPWWDARHGKALVTESVLLFGLRLSGGRRVNLAKLDIAAARELLIREGLVSGGCPSELPFAAQNRALCAEAEQWEQRLRRRDLVPSEAAMERHYRESLPLDIGDYDGCVAWLNNATQAQREPLLLNPEGILPSAWRAAQREAFPDMLQIGGLRLRVEYRFEPGEREDGVTLRVPLWALNGLSDEPCERLVPGMLREKCIALLKTLPRGIRSKLVPIPAFVDGCLSALQVSAEPLLDALGKQIKQRAGEEVSPAHWRMAELPAYLFMNFAVVDDHGVVATGRELAALKQAWGARAGAAFAALAADQWTGAPASRWDFGDLPMTLRIERDDGQVVAYPALSAGEESVQVRLYDIAELAQEAHRAGVRRLYLLSEGHRARLIRKSLPGITSLCESYRRLGTCEQLRQDILDASLDEALGPGVESVRAEAQFAALQARTSGRWSAAAAELSLALAPILEKYASLYRRLYVRPAQLPASVFAALQEHLGQLVFPHFVRVTPRYAREQLLRYLTALERRVAKAINDPAQDRKRSASFEPFWQRYDALVSCEAVGDARMVELRWLLEEFRVSLFAQELGTQQKVSPQRLHALLELLETDHVSAVPG